MSTEFENQSFPIFVKRILIISHFQKSNIVPRCATDCVGEYCAACEQALLGSILKQYHILWEMDTLGRLFFHFWDPTSWLLPAVYLVPQDLMEKGSILKGKALFPWKPIYLLLEWTPTSKGSKTISFDHCLPCNCTDFLNPIAPRMALLSAIGFKGHKASKHQQPSINKYVYRKVNKQNPT